MKTKICSNCRLKKPLDQFSKGNDKLGLKYYCKICVIDYNKKYRETHREQILKRDKEYNLKNKNDRKIYHQEYYKKHKNKILKLTKIYSKIHQNEIQKHRQDHKEQQSKLQKEWYLNNKEKINEQHKKYIKNKRDTNVNFKILCNMRNRLWEALKGNPKVETTMKLVGCNIEQLKLYLEKQFKEGMDWDNYGKWHIDHIKPCCRFNLAKIEEQQKCFNYMNLQPLWAKDNIKKGGR